MTAVVVLVVWFGFTHLLPRFLVMLVPVAAVAVGRASAGRLWPAGAAVAAAAAALGWSGVASQLTPWSLPGRPAGLFGVTDFAGIMADGPALADAVADGKQVGLVGDAQAFFFQVPMARLHYHTVFDLPAGEADPVAAYARPRGRGQPGLAAGGQPGRGRQAAPHVRRHAAAAGRRGPARGGGRSWCGGTRWRK